MLPLLKSIARSKSIADRCDKLSKAPQCLIRYIADTAGAVLRTDIPLEQTKYSKLKKYRNALILLTKKKPSLKLKRKLILDQKGGFLPIIIPAILSGIASFAGKALADAI